jgi:glutamine synthetase
MNNRTAAIRKIKSGHWELRGVDGTANPHLTLLAIITAGLLGFENSKDLEMKDPKKFMLKGIEGEHGLDPKDVGEYGIKNKFARSLKEAIELLKEHKPLVVALGPEIMDRYFRVNQRRGALQSYDGLRKEGDISEAILSRRYWMKAKRDPNV